MTRGRRPGEIPKKRVTFVLDEAILAKYELLIYDPVAGRSRWGVKSALVEKLIEKFIASFLTGAPNIEVRDLHHLLRK